MAARVGWWRIVVATTVFGAGLPACTSASEPAPPPVAAAPAAEWYVAQNGATRGPMTEDELRAELGAGTIARTDLVRRDGMEAWAPADAVLHSILGVGPADDAGGAFLAICSKVAEVSNDDLNTLEMYAKNVSPVPPESAVERVLMRHRALLTSARNDVTGTGHLDLDYSAGEALLLPHLAPTRRLAKMFAADAKFRLARGDTATAAADAAAMVRLARQVAGDRVAISSLVAVSVMTLFADTAVTLPSDADASGELRESLAWMNEDDPFGLANAFAIERTHGLNGNPAPSHEKERCRAAYDELIALFATTSDTSAPSFTAFFDRVESGGYGPLAKEQIGAVGFMLENTQKTLVRLKPQLARFAPE